MPGRLSAIRHVEDDAPRFEIAAEPLEAAHFEADVVEHAAAGGGAAGVGVVGEVEVDARQVDGVVAPAHARGAAERLRVPALGLLDRVVDEIEVQVVGHDGGRQRRVVPLRRRVQGSVVAGEGQVRRGLVEELDALALRGEDVAHAPRRGGRIELEARRRDRLERLHPERHVIQDRPFGAARRRPLVEEHQHVGERDHGRLPERAALAAEPDPEPGIGLHVAHVVVQMAHRNSGLVGSGNLPRRRRGRPRDQNGCKHATQSVHGVVSSRRHAAGARVVGGAESRRKGRMRPGSARAARDRRETSPADSGDPGNTVAEKPCFSATYLPVSSIHGRRSREGRTALRDRP